MKCRVCNSENSEYLWDTDKFQWYRCLVCASATSTVTSSETSRLYSNKEYAALPHGCKTFQEAVDQMGVNVDYFNRHREQGCEFLDIGCNEGASLAAFKASGWRPTGFDVNPHAARGAVIAPKFEANLFDKQFDAVMCREVIEHVEDWKGLLVEINHTVKMEGLFQLQTPRPVGHPHSIPYQYAHLQLFSTAQLVKAVKESGFEILELLAWEIGQMLMCRKIRSL